MNSHDPSIEEIIRRAREAGAADLHRQRPSFTRQSPAVSKDTPRQQRLRNFSLEKWHWCLGFTLCQSLISSILLLCSINPDGISGIFATSGIIASLLPVIPAMRPHLFGFLISVYVGAAFTALVFTLITILSEIGVS
jgi:hypothetical protein